MSAEVADNVVQWWLIATISAAMVLVWGCTLLSISCVRVIRSRPILRQRQYVAPRQSEFTFNRPSIVMQTYPYQASSTAVPQSSRGRSTSGTSGMTRAEFLKR